MNKSLTTLNNERALAALRKITPLTIALIRQERASNIWNLRDSISMEKESLETFQQNMKLIDEEIEEYD